MIDRVFTGSDLETVKKRAKDFIEDKIDEGFSFLKANVGRAENGDREITIYMEQNK